MRDELKVVNYYNKVNPDRIGKFNTNVDSQYTLATDYEKVEGDFVWLDLMEDTIRYLDNILRNPNRFIVNEEEVVKVEQARRITVESIKHLAKHTNFIQEINEKEEVKPSKVLNINKDESFNTYENRLIYTLINNMSLFVDMKEREQAGNSSLKDEKKCEYNAVSKIGAERVSINLVINSKTNFNKKDGTRDGLSPEERIARLKLRISDLKSMPVYQNLHREHVAKVIPPIKKTNVILKNVNFQYAMKLWNYIQNYVPTQGGKERQKKKIDDNLHIKQMLDDTFLLTYLTISSVNSDDTTLNQEAQDEAIKDLTNKMIDKIVEINTALPIEEIEQMIGDKLAIIKNKKVASLVEIEHKFNERLQQYTNKILMYNFR